MKKNIFWYALVLVACAVSLTACMNSAGEPEAAEPTPAPMATQSPVSATPTDMLVQTEAPLQQGAASDTFNWTDNVGEIEQKIDQLSEIDKSRVVINQDTALVAVEFAPTYQGELTERIREMVAAVIMEADPSIQTVAVTAEDADVQTVGSIADRLAGGTPLQDLAEEIEKIIRNVTTMR